MSEQNKQRETLRPNIRHEQEDILKVLREESLRNAVDRSNSDNPFHVPQELIPSGWTVEWKATHVMGQSMTDLDASYMVNLQQDGWVPAPVTIFKKMRPRGFTGNNIEQGGQILMMRPIELTEKKRAAEKIGAAKQMSDMKQKMGMTREGQMDRKVQAVKQSYERVEIPD